MAGGAEKLPGPLFDVREPTQSGLESAEKAQSVASRARTENKTSVQSVARSGQERIAFGGSLPGPITGAKHIQVSCPRNNRTLGDETLGFSGKYPS